MYYYIVDPQKIDQKSFERVQNQLYSSLAELKISGEMTRVTSLRSMTQLVDSAVERGATTIVAVGHDSTVQEIINAVGEKDVTVGYVPLENSEIAEILGAGDVVTACKNLAQRRVEMLDLGRIGNNYFFTKVSINASLESVKPRSIFDLNKFGELANTKPARIRLNIDEQFRAETEIVLGLVVNSRAGSRVEEGIGRGLADPTDGILDILLLPKISSYDAWKFRKEIGAGELEKIPGCTVMHGRQVRIMGDEDLAMYIGERAAAKSQAVLEALPRKIRMIVGKDRSF